MLKEGADPKRTRFDILEIDWIIERLQQKEAEKSHFEHNQNKTKLYNPRTASKRLKRHNTSTH